MEKIESAKLVLEDRKLLSMTGVQTVDGFSDTFIKLTVSGVRVSILGQKLRITAFNKLSGTLSVDGLINEIKYNYKKAPLLKRVFK